MNIENLLKVSQFKGFDACFSCQHSTTHHWLHFNFVKFVPLKWYVLHFGPKRAGQPPGLLSQRVSSTAERLWPTDGHVTTLLSLQWEAGGWWTGDGVTLDGPWSLCPRVPSPSALRDLLLESMIRFTLGCKPSILTQIRKSPTCFMLCWIETLVKNRNSQKWFWSKYRQAQLQVSPWSWLHNTLTEVFLWYILVPCLTMLLLFLLLFLSPY